MTGPYRTPATPPRPSRWLRFLCRVLGHRWLWLYPRWVDHGATHKCTRCGVQGIERYTPPHYWRIETED